MLEFWLSKKRGFFIFSIMRKVGNLAKDIFVFDGYLKGNEDPIPFQIYVSAPREDSLWKDWYSSVYAPPYLVRKKLVRGLSAEEVLKRAYILIDITRNNQQILNKDMTIYHLDMEEFIKDAMAKLEVGS